jgi:gamma-glutamyltranspeptidase/glutathione hydrolase
MKLLNKFNWNNLDYIDPMRFHIQAEVSKVCFEIKETILGDPQFNKIDIEYLMSSECIDMLFKKINLDKVYSSDKLFVTSHPETVYLTVVDNDLNAVSFINSICHGFGSGICSENSGVLFQNRGVNFRLEENHPNCIESNKRPLHTIIPGLLTNNSDETVMSYGVMGGQYQPIGQAHVLQNIFDFEMSIQEAIDAPRAFALNGKLKIENSFSKNSVQNLSNLGHEIEIVNEGIGGGQGIMIDRKEGVLIGGSDPRKDGQAIGY